MRFLDVFMQVLPLITPLVIAGLGYLSKLLADLIRAKTRNEYLSSVLVRLNVAVLDVVKAIEQNVVKEIKRANEDGKITDEEKQTIKSIALNSVKSYLGVKGLAQLGKILGLDSNAIDSMIETKIESAVLDLKKTQVLIPTLQ